MEQNNNKIYNNFALKQLEIYIRQTLIEAEIPVGVAYLILDKLTREMKDLYDEAFQQELILYKQDQKKINEKNQQKNEQIIQGIIEQNSNNDNLNLTNTVVNLDSVKME